MADCKETIALMLDAIAEEDIIGKKKSDPAPTLPSDPAPTLLRPSFRPCSDSPRMASLVRACPGLVAEHGGCTGGNC